ncbi:MAG: HAD family hydrolase [Dehalococcoidia bacterium]
MRAILWDLDDTLLDTAERRMDALAAAYQKCLNATTDPYALWRSRGGRTLESLGRDLLGARYGDFLEAFAESYKSHPVGPSPYPGIGATLARIAESGLQQAVVTSRGSWAATEELASCGLLSHFHSVIAFEDTDDHKPDPEPLIHALERLFIDDPRLTAYVGDTPADVTAAKAAGCRAVAATWGSMDREALLESAPDLVAGAPADVLDVLEGVKP